MTPREQLKAKVARIRPDATIQIVQKCGECDGRGHGDVRSHCRNCGHTFTIEEWKQEHERDRQAPDGLADTQLCGCDWRYRVDEDDCRACEGSGREYLTVTMQELAFALWRMQPSLDE